MQKIQKICSVEGCVQVVYCKNMCRKHYMQKRQKDIGVCSVVGCNSLVECRGLCKKHYIQLRQNGTLERKTQRREGVCSVVGCNISVQQDQLCRKHFRRKQKYGSTDRSALKQSWKNKETLPEYLARNSKFNKETKCIEWIGAIAENGYGKATYKNYPIGAHRLAYQIFVGEIPEGLWVLHKCDNPCCINPEHLYVGTVKDNARDRKVRGRCNIPYGEKSASAKLTEKQALEIYYRKKKGEDVDSIAKDYPVTRWTVYDIYNGKGWKKLKGVR